MDLNLVVLAGRLAAPPEVRDLEQSGSMLRMLVTVRGDTPRRRVDVVPVTIWDPEEELLAAPIQPGERVWVAGSVQRRFWDAAPGRRSRIEVIAHHVQRADANGEPTAAELA